MKKEHIGSDFDDFLQEEGLFEETETQATKRLLALQLAEVMASQNLTKTEMARRMNTSRAALDRLLDPSNSSVTLQTLESAAKALGKRLRVSLQ
jgi:antitoxin HicB